MWCLLFPRETSFNGIVKDCASSDIDIKQFHSSDKNKAIIVNNFTSVKKIEAYLEKETLQVNTFTID